MHRCNDAGEAARVLSRDMGGKLPVLNYNITLSDDASVHAQKALRYLFTDAEAIKHTSFMFNILVNNADFYSGTCYTDGGNTAWGDINKRGSEADPGSVWKWVTFNFKTGGADPVLKKLCDPDIKKHKITGKTFSVKASEISASKILGVGIEKFSYSVGVDNANWSYGCSISSSYSDDSASGSVSATWGGPAGAGNYNISATWIVYYLG